MRPGLRQTCRDMTDCRSSIGTRHDQRHAWLSPWALSYGKQGRLLPARQLVNRHADSRSMEGPRRLIIRPRHRGTDMVARPPEFSHLRPSRLAPSIEECYELGDLLDILGTDHGQIPSAAFPRGG
jgi:hypothetical protein